MRTINKIVLVIIIITLVYSVVKLINASIPQEQTIATITWPVNQSEGNMQNTENAPSNTAENTAMPTLKNTGKNKQKLYQADEILIDGQGQAGQNYIDITSTTPITPQQTQGNIAQTNTAQNNNGGAYAQASVTIDNNTANTSAQTYAPGVPAFEVLDGN